MMAMSDWEAERRLVYEVIREGRGPEVDMWSRGFGRLVGMMRSEGALANEAAAYKWLKSHGWFVEAKRGECGCVWCRLRVWEE